MSDARLVIDTALDAQSLAVLEGGAVLAHAHDVIGRGHAETLMPALAALLDTAGVTPGAVLVDVGPGSFTGLRIGIAAARALGLAWDVPVTGYASLALIAAPCFAADPALARLAVVAEAGRGQLYVTVLDRDLAGVPAAAMSAEAAAATLDPALPLAGPGARRVAALSGAAVVADAWPDARDAALLPHAACSRAPEPDYVRQPDAVAGR